MKGREWIPRLLTLVMGSFLITTASGSNICVSQETGPGDGNFAFLGFIDAFDRSGETAATVYSYNNPLGASYNGLPPDSISDVSQLFVVETSEGGSSLFFVHDRPEGQLGEFPADGGESRMQFNLFGDTAGVLLQDDRRETIVDMGGTQFNTDHRWVGCCTDGGVIGTLGGAWTMDAQFLFNAPFPPATGDGITAWQAASAWGPSIPLALEIGRRVRLVANCGLVDPKPGSNPNCVNPDSGGVISVAILTFPDFDATMVDLDAVLEFGGASPQRCAIEDVGADEGLGDGDLDLVCKFRKSEVDLPDPGTDCGFVTLAGVLVDGTPFNSGGIICLPGESTCDAGTPIGPEPGN